MKKLLFMLLVLTSLTAMSQTRPPIVTNELQTNILKWNDLLMYRDSLVYFRPVSETSFQVKRPSSSVWSTYDFTEIPDSFYIPDLNVWIVVGQPITQGDSTFYVRQKPNCLNCWQYSYNNWLWYNWFCSETGASNLSIDYNADDILGIRYNRGLGVYTDSLYFRAVEADSGRVPTIVGDSVLWRDIPRDSLFDAYSSDWLKGGDTIPKQLDSIQINGEWIEFGGTVTTPNDTSLWKLEDIGNSLRAMPKTPYVQIGEGPHYTDAPFIISNRDSSNSSLFVSTEGAYVGIKSIKEDAGYAILGQLKNGNGAAVHAVNSSEDQNSVAIYASTENIGYAIDAYGGILGGIAINASSYNNAIIAKSNIGTAVDAYSISGSAIKAEVPSTGKSAIHAIAAAKNKDVAILDGHTSTRQLSINEDSIYNIDGNAGLSINWNGASAAIHAKHTYEGASREWCGLFEGGKGVKVDSTLNAGALLIGSGATITRSGTIASKDIWTGTAAEFSANTVKDGITPQASTTIAFILD